MPSSPRTLTTFSSPHGDKRQPHPDIAILFAETGSSYGLGVEGLNKILLDHFGDELKELFEESDFKEEPRRLDEILEAEQEFFDRVWYHRSLMREITVEQEEGPEGVVNLLRIAGQGRRRVEAKYSRLGELGPYTDFELGMLNGKLSALRCGVRKRMGFSGHLMAPGASLSLCTEVPMWSAVLSVPFCLVVVGSSCATRRTTNGHCG